MKWVILGAGRSGMGAKALLEHHNQTVFLFDENTSKLSPEIRKTTIDDPNHPIFAEKHITLVISPGFSLEHEVLKKARLLKQDIISEIDLALSYFKGSLIAVTGTNGKSTTVMMIASLLKQLKFDFALGGNIGISASSLMIEKPRDYLVLELSSYQIEASQLLRPRVAVLTGIAPDHLLRHKTLKGYIEAKWRLFEHQGPEDLAIIEESVFNQAIQFQLPKPKARLMIVRASELLTLDKQVQFGWKHDRLNAFFALQSVAYLSGKTLEDLAPLLKTYKGLPFRCEIIGKAASWFIINDSKGTNIDSTLHALTNIHGKVTLFLGGLGKGDSFLDILKFAGDIEKVVAFGASSSQIFQELSPHLPVQVYKTLHEAMEPIQDLLKTLRGDLLFSPACASQDEFSDFEDRGMFFTQCVHKSLRNIPEGLCYEPILDHKTS